jgi:Hermansky-Pudlak syndrome 5 protein
MLVRNRSLDVVNFGTVSTKMVNFTSFLGDAAGNVSVVTLSFFIGRNLLTIQVSKILDELEGPIVQIDSFNDFLLVSSTTKTILCNNEREEFKQIGNRPRDGHFGSCFIIDYKGLEVKQNRLINIDEETYESLLLEFVKIYTCRPGMRLWEADLNGNVLKTFQFKNANFSGQQVYLINSRSSADSSPVLFDKTNQFQLAVPLNCNFIFTFNDSGFYIIDPKKSKIVFWTNEFDGGISDIKIVRDSDIYVYLKDGRLFELKFYKLQHYALHLCHSEKDFLKAGDLIKNNLDYFLSVIRGSGERNLNQYKVSVPYFNRDNV